MNEPAPTTQVRMRTPTKDGYRELADAVSKTRGLARPMDLTDFFDEAYLIVKAAVERESNERI